MNRFAATLALLALVGCSRSDVQYAEKPYGERSAATSSSLAMRKPGLPRFEAFSNLPDRGELLAYADRNGAKQSGAYTWHRVAISEDHALRAITERRLRVLTPSGQELDIEYDHHVEHPSGDWSWIGHLPGQPGAQTILTFGAEAVFGSIAQPDGKSLRLTSRSGSAWLVETDPAKLVGVASANPSKPDYLPVPKNPARVAGAPVRRAQGLRPAAASTAAVAIIDVLVGYTPGFVSRNGGTSAALTRLNDLVAITNQAYVNSQVNARIRLVHAMQVSYADNTANSNTLEQLTGYDVETQQYTTPNPAFNALRAAREQYGADLVVLVRPFLDPEQDGCGIAWLVGGGKYGIEPGDGQDYFGYSVVSDGEDVDYYCLNETFVHELAHNMGSAHDRETAKGDDGVLDDPDDYGAFAYSFGYKTTPSTGNFYTVMAYGDPGQGILRIFSNPRVSAFCGRACGTVNDDNARSLTQTMPVVATFRESIDTFDDVPSNYWAYPSIERIYDLGITGGCSASPPLYCPENNVLRDEMALFVLRAKYGGGYQPPAAVGIFADVPANYWAIRWIERAYNEGIVSGCSSNPRRYCPRSIVARDQMAIMLLRAKHGSNYQPPPATGMFTDVPTTYWAAAWIEQLTREGVTGGCSVSPSRYCPSSPVTRAQMAVFLVRNFDL